MACRTFSNELETLGLSALLDGASMPFAEPGTEPHYGPSRTVRISHIDLALNLDVSGHAFQGEATVSFETLPTFDGTVELDLDDVTVDAVQTPDGQDLPYTHDSDTLRIKGVTGTAVVVRWHHCDPTRGIYFTGPEGWDPQRQEMAWTQCQDEDAHFIFPCHDHPGTKHTWTLRLRAPAGYTLLGNGREVEQVEDEQGAYARFEQEDPMPAYLVVVVAARLVVEETTWRDRPVRYLVPEGEDEAILRAFGKTPLMMEHFSEITGVDYAWPRYDQVVVHDFIFGGMENTACTVMTDLLLVDEQASLLWDPDRLVCHELAHQWFGDLLTCQDWSQGWLNESWATFMEVIWWEQDRSAEDAVWYKFTQMQHYLGEDAGRYRRPIVSYRFREPIDVFDRHLYEKGACVMNTLRTELGEQAFWAGAKLYLDRHRHQTVHTRHFQRALEDATGRNLDRFFDQWIHGAGHPALEVKLAAEGGLLTVSVKQTQSGEQTAEAFHIPLKLEIVLDAGDGAITKAITLPIRERERTWAIPVEGEVGTVRVDPGFNMLSTIKLDAPRGWLETLAMDPDPVLAVRAIRGLLSQGDGKSVSAALDATRNHPAWQTRQFMAEKLGRRGGADVRDTLLAMLDDAHPHVQRAAANGLGHFREAVVADALLAKAAAPGPVPPQLVREVLEALGKTRDPRAVEALRPHLDTVSWADQTAMGAALGMAWTEDASVLDTLLAVSQPDQRPRLRMGAAAALGVLGDKVESVRARCVERLVEMLSEPGFREQLSAIGGLARIKDAASIPALERVHRDAPDGRTRRTAYEALYSIRKGRTTEAGLSTLRAKVDELVEQNARLRTRLEKLERVDA